MGHLSITCAACGATNEIELPDGADTAACPTCGADCAVAPEARPKLRLKMRQDEPKPAPAAAQPAQAAPPAGMAPPAAEPTEAEPAAGMPRPAVPPPLPGPPGAEPAPFPFTPASAVPEDPPLVYWSKFIGKVVAVATLLVAIHILGQMRSDYAFYFRFADQWTTRILFIGLMYLTIRESFGHFLGLLVGPLAMWFGMLDMASLTMDGALASPKTVFVSVTLVLVAIAYPIYLMYVVLRVIDSEKFKVFFFAMIVAGLVGGVYDFVNQAGSFKKAVDEDPVAAQGLQELLDYSGKKKSTKDRP